MVHKYYVRGVASEVVVVHQYRSRCQEDVSTTCLYPCLMSGGRHSGAGDSGVDSDL